MTDANARAKGDDGLAKTIAENFYGPVEIMFLSPEGKFLSKLSAIKDFTDIHPDTSIRPGQCINPNHERNMQVFLARIQELFGYKP